MWDGVHSGSKYLTYNSRKSSGSFQMVTIVTFLILSLIWELVLGGEVEDKFEEFIKKYQKKYANATEKEKRFKIFKEEFDKISAFNTNPNNTHRQAINQFSDMTDEEFASRYLNGVHLGGLQGSGGGFAPMARRGMLPLQRDWTQVLNMSNKVVNQQCGNCWVHGSVGGLEYYAAMETGKIVELSVPQVTHCASNPYNCGNAAGAQGADGCFGATSQIALHYTNTFGVMEADKYPALDVMQMECKYDGRKMKPKVINSGYNTLPRNNYTAVMEHLAYHGPLIVVVSGSHMKNYADGVIDCGDNFDDVNLDHIVLLTGYGEDIKRGKYFTIKNTWGDTWGDGGWGYLKRHDEPKCGYDIDPKDGTGCPTDHLPKMKVCGSCGILYDATYPIGVQVLD